MEGDHHFRYVESSLHRWLQLASWEKSDAHLTDDRATHPSSGPEALEQIMENFANVSGGADGGSDSNGDFVDDEDTKEVKEAKQNPPQPEEFEYTERDVLLYNLGVGAKVDQLQWVYENADGFQVSLIDPSS